MPDQSSDQNSTLQVSSPEHQKRVHTNTGSHDKVLITNDISSLIAAAKERSSQNADSSPGNGGGTSDKK